jgi:hypothetical protein
LNPPFGRAAQKEGLELWGVSYGSLGAGVQYSNPIGFYFALGIHMLIIGPQRVGNINFEPLSPSNTGTFVYPFPLPEVTIGWLFGG